MPVLPLATEIGLVNVPIKPPFKVALKVPLESPMVIVPVPKEAATVPITAPLSIKTPPVNIFAPERVSVPAPALVSA